MKKLIILLLLLMLNLQIFASAKIYRYTSTPARNRAILRPTYNPYSNSYRNPYFYKKYNRNNAKRLQRLRRFQNMNRIRNGILSWNSNRQTQGALTGYSTPIGTDIYKQIGISPMFDKQNSKSPTCNNDLFSTPSGVEWYDRNGEYYKDLKGVSSKTGVTILYD